MARLHDYVFPTNLPPNVVDGRIGADTAKQRIPSKHGNVQIPMGTDNMSFNLSGRLYNENTDADKRFTELMEFMDLFNLLQPMSFCYDVFHPFGEDGDAFTEYSSQAALDADWTADGPTIAPSTSFETIGTYDIQMTNPGTGNRRVRCDGHPRVRADRPHFSSLCFFLFVGDFTKDVTIGCYTDAIGDGNNFTRKLGLSGVLGTVEVVLPVGEGASTSSSLDEYGWYTTGSPSWDEIDGTYIEFDSGTTGTWYLDGLTYTHAVTISGVPQIRYPPGRPDQLNYRLQLKQFIQ